MDLPKIIPYLTVRNAAEAIGYYTKVLGASEDERMKSDDGKHLMHAQITVNGAVIFLSDAFPQHGGPMAPTEGSIPPVGVVLNFAKPDQVDATYKRAMANGAKSMAEPRDEFWGARFAVFICPYGHRWVLNAAKPK